MSAPDRMVLQPCAVNGWDYPDRVKYAVAPATEYIRADLAATESDALRAALVGMVDMYVEMVESGDCGFWDAEKVPQVIAARAALAEAKP